MPAVPWKELTWERAEEPSAAIRARVVAARGRQLARFKGRTGLYANAHMSARDVRHFCPASLEADRVLRAAMQRLAFSARSYHRVLKIARTIADLDGAERLELPHVSEAIQYRSLDRARPGATVGAKG